MRKRSFFGLSKPSFQYELATDIAATPITIPKPQTVTLYIKKELKHSSKNLKTGMQVKTGQRLMLDEGDTVATVARFAESDLRKAEAADTNESSGE